MHLSREDGCGFQILIGGGLGFIGSNLAITFAN